MYEDNCKRKKDMDCDSQDNAGSGEERMMDQTNEESEYHPSADGENEVTVMQGK